MLMARLEGLEDNNGDDGIEEIDGGPFEVEDLGQLLARTCGLQDRGHDGRSRDDQDGPEHHRCPPVQPEKEPSEEACSRPSDRNAEAPQPALHQVTVSLEAGDSEIEAPIEQDDGDRKADQRLERGTEELVRVDRDGQDAGDESNGEEQDNGRNAQLGGDDLRARPTKIWEELIVPPFQSVSNLFGLVTSIRNGSRFRLLSRAWSAVRGTFYMILTSGSFSEPIRWRRAHSPADQSSVPRVKPLDERVTGPEQMVTPCGSVSTRT